MPLRRIVFAICVFIHSSSAFTYANHIHSSHTYTLHIDTETQFHRIGFFASLLLLHTGPRDYCCTSLVSRTVIGQSLAPLASRVPVGMSSRQNLMG
ncbi:hypothetical protein B0H16DRAFT_1564276 [Mycena metata]|uniref:Secreted protein n=1 Tax=Mycena metata TaxID=1033252 RepID=A0AAD7IFS1_9AGAR|nr:hypothetical protein B0H16DRAFT_1564276 [Mycena metata]